MNWTKEQRKQLIDKYPYLQPRNLWTGEIADDYDYTYLVGEHSCPTGWERLFFLYCKNIEPLLAKQHCSKFMFSDVKEKYGTLRMYDFGAPEDVHALCTVYECYSKYICQKCGARATVQTTDWISSFCDKCIPNTLKKYSKALKYRKKCSVEVYQKDSGRYRVTYSFKELNIEYMKIQQLTDDEFFEYLIS